MAVFGDVIISMIQPGPNILGGMLTIYTPCRVVPTTYSYPSPTNLLLLYHRTAISNTQPPTQTDDIKRFFFIYYKNNKGRGEQVYTTQREREKKREATMIL